MASIWALPTVDKRLVAAIDQKQKNMEKAFNAVKPSEKPLLSTLRGDFSFKPVLFGGSKLLADEMLRFDVPVTPQTSAALSEALVQLSQIKKETGGSIKLLISNSPGGSVYHGLHIIDTMNNLGTPVDTVILGGQTASMGALIFISGTKGRRFMSQHATLLIHRPSAGGISGTQMEISNTAREIERMRDRMDHLISQKSTIPVTQVRAMTNQDTIIYPLRALKLGLTDWVLVGGEDKALSPQSVAGLTDAQIDALDAHGDYSSLKTFSFDAKLSRALPGMHKPRQDNILGGLLGIRQFKRDPKGNTGYSETHDPSSGGGVRFTERTPSSGLDVSPYLRSLSVYA